MEHTTQDIEILYEDRDITVAVKPPQMISEHTDAQNGFADLMAARNSNRYVGVIHRLDRGVGGVMVYARTQHAARVLSASVQAHTLQKEYLAVIHGLPTEPCATLRDLLFHDRIRNKTFIAERARKGVKEAVLDYTVTDTVEHPVHGRLTLLSIRLHTGRTHQIRVQFASRGMPLLGDGKYGARGDRCDIALFCRKLSFPHPNSGEPMRFSKLPMGDIWNSFLLTEQSFDKA